MFEILYLAFFLFYLGIIRLVSWLGLKLSKNRSVPGLCLVHLATLIGVAGLGYFYHSETGLGFLPALLGFMLPPSVIWLIVDLVRQRRRG